MEAACNLIRCLQAETSREGGPQKHHVGNGIDKTLTVSCESPTEDIALVRLEKRILALETALWKWGLDDVAGESPRLKKDMIEHNDKSQKLAHDQVHNALSCTHEAVSMELHAEFKHPLESNLLAMTKYWGTMPPKETSSTSTSEDLDASMELKKLMSEMRKEIHEVHNILSARTGVIERRLEELEPSISARCKEVKDFTENTHLDASLLSQWVDLSRHRSISSQGCSNSRVASTAAVIFVGVGETPRHPNASQMDEVKKILQDVLTTTKERLDDATESVTGCSNTVLVDGHVGKISAPHALGYKFGNY